VLSARGAKTLVEDVERSRQIGDELLVDGRGRLPRVGDIVDPTIVGVHRAAALTVGDSSSAHTPPFIPRDCSAELEDAVRHGGFVLVIGESAAGKSRAAFEAIRTCLPAEYLAAGPQLLLEWRDGWAPGRIRAARH
jgi:eukaryotic-like serine/threonine-protein kinase